MTITEFLEARIADDMRNLETGGAYWEDCYGPECHDRMLAECEAKRKVVQYGAGLRLDRTRDAETDAQYRSILWIMQQMARVYADHPDYRGEWVI